MYAFKCGEDNRINLKGVSKSQPKHNILKNIKIVCGEKYPEKSEN